MDEFIPALSRIAASYGRSSHDSEDLLQEILLAVWQALPRFQGKSSLRTYVFRIAHNRGLRYVWQLKMRKATDVQTPKECVSSAQGPAEIVESSDKQQRLMHAIRKLPLSLRQVMTLALEGLGHEEISQILGISENNSAVRLHRARDLLRKQLGGQHE